MILVTDAIAIGTIIPMNRRYIPCFAALLACLATTSWADDSQIPMVVQTTIGAKSAVPAPGSKLTVLIFVLPDCPISNAYAPEVARISREYRAKGVSTLLVYSDKGLKAEAAEKHRREYNYPCSGVMDTNYRLAKLAGATKTPEAVLLSPKAEVLYRGRIDDLYADYGKRRPSPTQRDLRNALDLALAGKPINVKRATAIGCYIPDLPK